MLGELASIAEESGNLSLSGRAAQFERDVPFAVFIDALDGFLAAQTPRAYDGLDPEQLAALARIFPSLRSIVQLDGGAVQAERHLVHRAVRVLLELLAGAQPVVLILDDVQWADAASVELVGHLLRRPARAVLVAVAFRPGEMPDGLVESMAPATRDGRLERLDLAPLSEMETAEAMPGVVDDGLRGWLYRESGGNPFYAEQLYRSAGSRGPPPPSRASLDLEIPSAVAAALDAEVSSLEPDGRRLLEGAAVAGDPFLLELAAAAAALDESASHLALDELLARELVLPTEAPRRVRFRHPIVRRTVYAAAPLGWRMGAHARAREQLQSLGAEPIELAHHVEQSAAVGDEEAVSVLEAAGHAASELAPGSAADWFDAALRLLPPSEAERRAAILAPQAKALGACGRLEESRETLSELLELLPREAEPERASLTAALAGVDHLGGRHDAARARLRSALDAQRDQGSPPSIALQVELAADARYRGENREAREWGELATAGARRVDVPELLAIAEVLLSAAHHGVGDVDAAEEHQKAALELVDALDDESLIQRLDAIYLLGFCEYLLDRYEDGARHLERGIVLSRSSGQGQYLIQMKSGLAWCLIEMGRVREATTLSDDAIESARITGGLHALPWLLAIDCWIARLLGDARAAVRSGEEGLELVSGGTEDLISASVRAHLALACAAAGEHERCIAELTTAGAPDFPMFTAGQRPIFCEALSIATLGLGRQEEAAAWASRAESFAEHQPPVARAAAQRARARLLMQLGEEEDAAELALKAVAGLGERGARTQAASTRVLAARALAGAGMSGRAIEELERAYAEHEACGADRRRDEAARELRLLGRQVPRTAPRREVSAGVEALSDREREIAELVAEAKTNREIAETLYISEKTVEKHLSKVFAKLGVKGRAAVGAKLVEADQE